jgi:uncharacterized protein
MGALVRSMLPPECVPLLVSCAVLAAASEARAAAFDCEQASLPAEKAICGNENLSKLDARTAGMYFTILGSDAPATTLADVEGSQRKFLQTRNACGTDLNCLVDAYTSQMMYLKNVRSELGAR